jgi:hypothetical protein
MRLGQLARKLAVKPAEIVEFLVTKQLQAEEGINTRLEDEHITLIIQHFAPSMTLETVVEEPVVQEEPAVIESLPVPEPVIAASEPVAEADTTVGQSEEEKIALIKAPKVELPGLKVLGKIELPDPAKKKSAPAAEGAESAESATVDPSAVEQPMVEKKTSRPERKRNAPPRTERKDQRPRKNPVALQREREAQEAAKKREEEAELAKQRKTQHYLKKVKVSGPTKSAKLYNEPVVELSDDMATPPKTWLGKFFRWFKS